VKTFAINGRFIVRSQTGQERFATEIIQELDKLIPSGVIELIIPKYTVKEPHYRNIKVVRYGNVKKHLWEQINFLYYIIKHKKIGINLCTTCPLLKPDINTIHDISYFVNPHFFKNWYGRLSLIWHILMYLSTFYLGKKILTVSNFSKNEIMRVFHVRNEKIEVLGNSWKHMEKTNADNNIFIKYNILKKGEYFFSASSLTPQKNIDWILMAAKNNPQNIFAIAGEKLKLTLGKHYNSVNILYLGYVSDGEMKSLMQNCKAFIHPALYEGFGIPPLEALSVGAKIIVSKKSCLPEIFEKSAYYIDPHDPDVNLDKLLEKEVESPDSILEKYTWEKYAKCLLEVLIKY
jgi:glycosyltransferase involved in cell wall biosynthesis